MKDNIFGCNSLIEITIDLDEEVFTLNLR